MCFINLVLIIGRKYTFILKAILPSSMNEFDTLIKKTRAASKRAGLTKLSVKEAIKKARQHD
jgi:hypothetical protein